MSSKTIKEPDYNSIQNTDVELWREPHQDGTVDYYSNSIHRTERGGIGINVGGLVDVMTLEEWHKLAQPLDDTKYILKSEIQEIINECKPKSSVLPELDIAVDEYQSNLEKRLK